MCSCVEARSTHWVFSSVTGHTSSFEIVIDSELIASMRLAVSELQDPLFFSLSMLGLPVGAATLVLTWVLESNLGLCLGPRHLSTEPSLRDAVLAGLGLYHL